MPNFVPYALTELDHLLMPAYMHLFVTLESSDKQESIIRLQTGVSRLVQEWPFLAGTIAKPRSERPNQKAYQVQPPSTSELQASPMLQVKSHDASVSVMGLAEETPEGFIAVKPRSPTPYPSPALRFQANIMTDGIILAASWHHRFMDAFGCQAALDGLSQFCRMEGAAGVTLKISSRTQEAVRQRISNFSGLTKSHAVFADTYSPAECHYQDGQITRGYVLCARKIKMLREACNYRLVEVGKWLESSLTCDDIVTAIIWLSAAQARYRAFSESESSLLRYVNLRKMIEPCAFTAFFGNAIAISMSHWKVRKLPSGGHGLSTLGWPGAQGITRETINDLSNLAWLGRSKDASIDAHYVGDLLSTLRASLDWDSLTVSSADVSVSSIRRLPLYGLDFGESFGPVRDVDFVDSYLHGQCIIRPARNCASDAPWEIRMALRREVFQYLEVDPVITWARINEKPRL